MMAWRLYQVMADRGIRTSVELQRKLASVGVHVSSQNLLRLIKENPKRVSSDIMYGLTEVLECTAGDLWVNPNDMGGYPPVHKPQHRKESKKQHSPRTIAPKEDDLKDIIGPTLTPFVSTEED